jgi:hypothetical protein
LLLLLLLLLLLQVKHPFSRHMLNRGGMNR